MPLASPRTTASTCSVSSAICDSLGSAPWGGRPGKSCEDEDERYVEGVTGIALAVELHDVGLVELALRDAREAVAPGVGVLAQHQAVGVERPQRRHARFVQVV